jgi:hypothetical protein
VRPRNGFRIATSGAIAGNGGAGAELRRAKLHAAHEAAT